LGKHPVGGGPRINLVIDDQLDHVLGVLALIHGAVDLLLDGRRKLSSSPLVSAR
jgi:hypothetical protein